MTFNLGLVFVDFIKSDHKSSALDFLASSFFTTSCYKQWIHYVYEVDYLYYNYDNNINIYKMNEKLIQNITNLFSPSKSGALLIISVFSSSLTSSALLISNLIPPFLFL